MMPAYRCARCANWTTYCDDCKGRSRLRANARQRALKQLQRRYPDEFADIYELEKVKLGRAGDPSGESSDA